MADDLRTRESVRRKALWTLSHLMPGDPKAAAILDVLDDIEEQERVDLNRGHPGVDIDAARKAVLIERHIPVSTLLTRPVFHSRGVSVFYKRASARRA
jgi:hypothetical protein